DLEALRRIVDLGARATQDLAKADSAEDVADDRRLALASNLEVRYLLLQSQEVGLGHAHAPAEGLALDIHGVELNEPLNGEAALLQPRGNFGQKDRLHELVEGPVSLVVEVGRLVFHHLLHRW